MESIIQIYSIINQPQYILLNYGERQYYLFIDNSFALCSLKDLHSYIYFSLFDWLILPTLYTKI